MSKSRVKTKETKAKIDCPFIRKFELRSVKLLKTALPELFVKLYEN